MDDKVIDIILDQLKEQRHESSLRFDKLEEKVDTLMLFRWKIAGGAVAVSAILTLLSQGYLLYSKFNQ